MAVLTLAWTLASKSMGIFARTLAGLAGGAAAILLYLPRENSGALFSLRDCFHATFSLGLLGSFTRAYGSGMCVCIYSVFTSGRCVFGAGLVMIPMVAGAAWGIRLWCGTQMVNRFGYQWGSGGDTRSDCGWPVVLCRSAARQVLSPPLVPLRGDGDSARFHECLNAKDLCAIRW